MELYIDTSKPNNIIVRINGDEYIENKIIIRGQDILMMIDKLLAKKNRKRGDIRSIKVITKGGDYSSTMVGVAVANALGKAQNISVNSNKPGEYVRVVKSNED